MKVRNAFSLRKKTEVKGWYGKEPGKSAPYKQEGRGGGLCKLANICFLKFFLKRCNKMGFACLLKQLKAIRRRTGME